MNYKEAWAEIYERAQKLCIARDCPKKDICEGPVLYCEEILNKAAEALDKEKTA